MFGNPIEALNLRSEATDLYRRIVGPRVPQTEDLCERDFDELVAFWSR